jgi:hypothetical protein
MEKENKKTKKQQQQQQTKTNRVLVFCVKIYFRLGWFILKMQ